MKKIIIELYRNQKGQGMVEYSLIISLVILATVGAVTAFGDGVKALYERIRDEVITAL